MFDDADRVGENSFHVFDDSMWKDLRIGFDRPQAVGSLYSVQLLEGREASDLSSDRQLLDDAAGYKRLGVWEKVLRDQTQFYSVDNLFLAGFVFGLGAVVANSNLDATIQSHVQTSLHRASTDEWLEGLHANKELGNGRYTLPIMGAVWISSEWIDGPPAFETVGLWGERSFRGVVVGAIPLLVTQRLTGGSRPGEISEGSDWHPIRDNNGVSGHAFMSSIPFITAAKLTDNIVGKTFWYSASLLGPLSRVNDNAHYPSQVGLGWTMGFLAASAVQQTDTGRKGWRIVPEASFQSSGLAFQYRW